MSSIEIPKKPRPQFKTRVSPAPPMVVEGQVGRAVVGGVVKLGKKIVEAGVQLDQKLKKAEATTQANQAYRQSVVAFDQFIRDLEQDNEWGPFEQRFEQRADEIYAQQAEGITIQEGQRKFSQLFEDERVRRLIQTKDIRRQKQLAYLQAELQLDIELGIEKGAEGDENYLKDRLDEAVADWVITPPERQKILTAAEDAVDWKKEWNLVGAMPYEAGMKYLLDNSQEHFLEEEKRRIAMADQLRHKHGLQVENNNREKRTAIADVTNKLMDRYIKGDVPDYADVAGMFNKISTNDPDVVNQKFTWLNRLEVRNEELERREKAEGRERIAEEKGKKEDRREAQRIEMIDGLDDDKYEDYDEVKAAFPDLDSSDLQNVLNYYTKKEAAKVTVELKGLEEKDKRALQDSLARGEVKSYEEAIARFPRLDEGSRREVRNFFDAKEGSNFATDVESVIALAAKKIQGMGRLSNAQISLEAIDAVEKWINDRHGAGISTKTMRTYWGDLNALRKRKRDSQKPSAEKDPNLLTNWELYEESLNMEDDPKVTLAEHLEWLNDHAGVDEKGNIGIGMKDTATLKNRARSARRDETMKEIYGLVDSHYRIEINEAWNEDEKQKLTRDRLEMKQKLRDAVGSKEAELGRKLDDQEKLQIYDNMMKPKMRNRAITILREGPYTKGLISSMRESEGEKVERLFYEGKTFGLEEYYEKEFGDLREDISKTAEDEFRTKRGGFIQSYRHPKFWLPIIEKVKGAEYYVKIEGEWFSLDIHTLTPNKIKL